MNAPGHRRVRSREIVAQGIGVSPGVAVGPAMVIAPEEEAVIERRLAAKDVPAEIARFEAALIETRRQLNRIQENVEQAVGRHDANIFDVHKMVLDDTAFLEQALRLIEGQHVNAEAAVHAASERYAAALAAVEDEYLRERVADVKDVSRRVVRNLAGGHGGLMGEWRQKCIIVARDLAPSETASLRKDMVLGFATDQGSKTSHTAIMARALGIPAVVGLGDITARVRPGERLLMDGTKGVVVIRPTQRRLRQSGKAQQARRDIQAGLLDPLRDLPAQTTDGHRIALFANVELVKEIPDIKQHGAEGIGLFRTEYLYISQPHLPTEDEQFEAYRRAASEMAPAPVVIRTLDLGGDKFSSSVPVPPEINPFLGFRAIRFCLAQPEIFKCQLRAILRASAYGRVHIMYPMISNVEEVKRANALLEECRADLRERQIPFDEALPIGAMIEIPSAALTADLMAPHVAFFSLGTNDLVQYTLAVDRVNDRVAHLYEPTHPAVLKLIRNTIVEGHRRGIHVAVCGQMAADPLMAPLLVGLGVDELSMGSSWIPAVKDVIRHISMKEAQDLAESALKAVSAQDVMRMCRGLTARKAPEIMELVG